MRIVESLAIVSLLALGFASAAAAAVDVTFVEPEHYTDPNLRGGYGEKARAPALREIKTYLERLGERYLKPNQQLDVEVLDIDLAGRHEPWRAFTYNARILRGITWSSITLRYSLRGNGALLLSAEERVSDLAYLMRRQGRYASQPLPYEKAMLESWFRNRFERLLPPA